MILAGFFSWSILMGARIRQPKTYDRPFRPVPVKPKSKNKFQHFLITRFNVRVRFNKRNGINPEWISHRWPFFSKYCVPSIRSQTAKGRFTWLVIFAEETPEEWKQKIREVSKGVFEPIWTPGGFGTRLAGELVRERLDKDTKYVITSRLDSDDIISKDYVARIQTLFNDQRRMFINFKHGIAKVVKGRTTEYRALQHPRSAFLSLIENVNDKFTTVYCGDHGQVTRKKNVKHIRGHYGWIQVLHGRNGCSATRGRRMIETELALMKKVFKIW